LSIGIYLKEKYKRERVMYSCS